MRRNTHMAIKESMSAGEKHWSQSSHTDCRIGPGLFPSSLSMISRKRNRSSDPPWRSNTSLSQISPSHISTLKSLHFCSFLFKYRYLAVPGFQSLLYLSWAHSVHTGTMWHQQGHCACLKACKTEKKKSVCWKFTLHVCTKTCEGVCMCMVVPERVDKKKRPCWWIRGSMEEELLVLIKTTAVLFAAHSPTKPVVEPFPRWILMTLACTDSLYFLLIHSVNFI